MSVLLDTRYFPAYDDLPAEFEPCLDYYSLDGIPSRHWCFMGEIVDGMFFMRYRLDVKDRTGKLINVSFYLDRGEPLDGSSFEPGNTIFIRYAKQHFFMDGSIGLRVEDSPSVLVLPYSMDTIMNIHHDIVKNRCKKCGESAKNRCAKCRQSTYCSRECQVADWSSHKHDCAILAATATITHLDHTRFKSFEPLSQGGLIGYPL